MLISISARVLILKLLALVCLAYNLERTNCLKSSDHHNNNLELSGLSGRTATTTTANSQQLKRAINSNLFDFWPIDFVGEDENLQDNLATNSSSAPKSFLKNHSPNKRTRLKQQNLATTEQQQRSSSSFAAHQAAAEQLETGGNKNEVILSQEHLILDHSVNFNHQRQHLKRGSHNLMLMLEQPMSGGLSSPRSDGKF